MTVQIDKKFIEKLEKTGNLHRWDKIKEALDSCYPIISVGYTATNQRDFRVKGKDGRIIFRIFAVNKALRFRVKTELGLNRLQRALEPFNLKVEKTSEHTLSFGFSVPCDHDINMGSVLHNILKLFEIQPKRATQVKTETAHNIKTHNDNGLTVVLNKTHVICEDETITDNFYEICRHWLIKYIKTELSIPESRAEMLVDLHTSRQNLVIDTIEDYHSINHAINQDNSLEKVSQLLRFEDVNTMIGIYRVHCRNLVNRQGLGDVNRGLPNPTKNPKLLCFLNHIKEDELSQLVDCQVLCQKYLEIARYNPNIFSVEDRQSFEIASDLQGDRLLNLSTRQAVDIGMMQGWIKVLKGMIGGVRYFQEFAMNANRFIDYVETECKTYMGLLRLIKKYKQIPEVGDALAANFFADLGFEQFCKPDIHVCRIIKEIYDKNLNEMQVFEKIQRLSAQCQITPRQLDKILFLAGSGKLYLVNRSLGEDKNRTTHLIRYVAQKISGS